LNAFKNTLTKRPCVLKLYLNTFNKGPLMVASAISPVLSRQSDLVSYRVPGAVRERLELVWCRRDDERRSLPAWLRNVHHSRTARTVAGMVGVVMGLSMFASSAVPELRDGWFPAAVLVAAFPAMGFSYAVGRLGGRLGLALRLRRWLRRDGSPEHELARLLNTSADKHVSELVYEMEASSIAWPMMALAVLMPLAIHLALFSVHAAAKDNLAALLSDDFSEWIAMSGVVVGHAHLYLMVASAFFANTLRHGQPESLRAKGWIAFAITVGVAAVPGVILLALPPLITAATGILFIPAMYHWALRTVARERWLLRATCRYGLARP
jgi:hypothetical protein